MTLSVGTQVRIIRGSNKGIIGTVAEVRADGRVRVATPNWSGVWLVPKSVERY